MLFKYSPVMVFKCLFEGVRVFLSRNIVYLLVWVRYIIITAMMSSNKLTCLSSVFWQISSFLVSCGKNHNWVMSSSQFSLLATSTRDPLDPPLRIRGRTRRPHGRCLIASSHLCGISRFSFSSVAHSRSIWMQECSAANPKHPMKLRFRAIQTVEASASRN